MPETLASRAILVAEDEYFIANDLKRALVRAGATVVGPAASVDRATDLIEATPHIDGAILDVNLGGEKVFPVADVLRERGVPFVFTTGYDQAALPERYAVVLRLEKPVEATVILQEVRRLFGAE